MQSNLRTLLAVLLLFGVCQHALAQTRPSSFDVKVTGSGPPLILIPGLLSGGEVWDSAVERYKDRYTLHVLTLAGFGGPPPIGAPFLGRVRDDVISYIRDGKMQKVALVGHSLGGFLAFWVALTAPDLVSAVVAVDGVPFLPALTNQAATPETMTSQAEQIKKIYASLTPDQLRMQTRMALSMMITGPADVERATSWAARSDATTAGIAVAEIMSTDLREQTATITAPTLLVAALGGAPAERHEAMTKAYEAQVSRIKTARVVVATKARHFVMLDDPSFLFTATDDFLKANYPSR